MIRRLLVARRAVGARPRASTFLDRTLWVSPGVDLPYQADGAPHGRGSEAFRIKLLAPLDPAGLGALETANLVGSLGPDGRHRPVIDCDYGVRLYPSSRDGHWHLYLDKPVSWPRYCLVLVALAHAGLAEWAFVGVALWRGMSAVRPPWRRKRMADLGRDDWTRLARRREHLRAMAESDL